MKRKLFLKMGDSGDEERSYHGSNRLEMKRKLFLKMGESERPPPTPLHFSLEAIIIAIRDFVIDKPLFETFIRHKSTI